MILNLHSDPCPTGMRALASNDHIKMPMLTWMASSRMNQARFPNVRNIFDESMADIEIMGLIKQAEAVRSESANAEVKL